jgi:alkylated DNA repair dioxygenase AlkB
MMGSPQPGLFNDPDLPPGFEYRPDFLTEDEERQLLGAIAGVTFSAVEMRGGIARRRTAHYGWTYGYTRRQTEPGEPIAPFLLPIRTRAALWVGIPADELAEALLTEYPPGAPIGWHRDAPMFDVIAGISIGAPCRMKFRPYVSPRDLGRARRPPRRTTHAIELAPRSAYVMRGVARRDYEHSIPPVDALRYSVTFRSLRAGVGSDGR